MNMTKKVSYLAFLLYFSNGIAENAQQALVTDPNYGTRSVVYENKDGYAVMEGDIIIGTIEEMQRQGAIVHKMLNKRWPNGVLPYKINKDMPVKNRTYIQEAMDHIEGVTNVQFVEVTSSNQNQYSDYVEFMPSKSTCSSYVGRIGGRQGISLAPGCRRGASIHEICHALGFWHEQSRSDRDSYVRVVWENIRESAKGNFNIQETNGFRMGGYDYGSIMHYGPRAFSANGKDTIVPLKSGAVIGQRDGLSQIDIQTMNKIYKKQEYSAKTDN